MKFAHNQKMKVKSGFWRGKKGFIKDYKQEKDGSIVYIVNIKIDDRLEKIPIPESDLKPSLF